jgi:asparagine synthase (glutamine-hydrolysing)
MCGIFAAIGQAVPELGLERVFRTLRHRGPDGHGLYVDEAAKLTLAHTRLAIIDLQTGAQPLYSAEGDIILVCNGEIYDFERIRSELERKGYRFKTKSDSEIIIALYQEYGLEFVGHLRGEFAFLLYDKAKRRLIAARDRFGIKPLYFSRLKHGFVFASEMKAIFASGLVEPILDVVALDPLINHDAENVRFPFKGVEHVPPACYVSIDLSSNEVDVVRYWSAEIPAETAKSISEPIGDAPAEAAAIVLEHLEEAVRLRLRADVPVGLYLSGGIDSAFVGALMVRNLNSKLHSFSISFEGSDRNEQRFACRAAEHFGTVHHELSVTKQALWDHLEDCLWFSELPFVSLAPVGKFLLSAEARNHVTVVLTGEGADEVFLGYRSYFQKAIDETRKGAPNGSTSSARNRRLKLPRPIAPFAEKLSLFIVDKSHRRELRQERSRRRSEQGEKPIINAVQEARLAAMPLDILCYLGDREEMAHSLEARVPFLDHELFDAARTIPVDFKMRKGVEKAVLRDAARYILPDDLRMRRKAGFMLTSEAVDLFGTDREAAEYLQGYLSKAAFKRAGVFSYRAYLLVSLLARIPGSKRVRSLKRLRRSSNKVLMFMLQTHMLHEMFVEKPRWMDTGPDHRLSERLSVGELVS